MLDQETKSRFTLPAPTWAVAGLIVAWGLLISQVRHHWGGESYYNFGYFVPPLAVWLFLRNLSKIPTRDEGQETRDHSLRQEIPTLVACFLSLIPVILFHALSEVNPFWRVPLWAQGCCLSAFTLVLLYRYYGWAGIRAGIFPLIFLVTMIPWPWRFEQWIIQSLTGIVIGFAVNGLHFLSYPVEMAGNTIHLDGLTIGVDDACSGIRSLQALFMVTLFLGSLFGQSLRSRIISLVVLPVVVIVVNTARAMFLSIQVIVNGQEAYDSWHDPAGYIAFGVSMIIIYATIELLNIGGADSVDSQKINIKHIASRWQNTLATRSSIAYLVLPVFVFIVVESWFRYHEMMAPEQKTWEFNLPDETDPSITYGEISDRVQEILGYSFGYNFVQTLSPNSAVDVYYYGYTPDNKLSSVSSYGHPPTICMQGGGSNLIEEVEPLLVEVGSIQVQFRHFIFEIYGSRQKLNVFWCVYENRNMDISPKELEQFNYDSQWVQLRKGRRDFSRRVMLISHFGADNPYASEQTVNRLLNHWISPYSN